MSIPTLSLRTVTGVAIAAILAQPLAGCSGASSSLPTTPASPSSVHFDVPAAANAKGSAAQRVSPDKSGQKLFVADAFNSKIYVFNAATKVSNPPVQYTIVNGISAPNGIATDASGNLWVANLASNTVTEYAKNSTSPEFTISNGMNGPVDVKVDGFGNVYVAMNGEFSGGVNTIVEYQAGTANPIYTWNVPASKMQITGIALINPNVKNGTSVYALESQFNGSSAVGGLLSCFPGPYNEVCTQLTNYAYGQTGGIAIASEGNKPFEFLAVDQYLPGIDETASYPPSVKRLISGGTPEFVTLNAKGKRLFVADRFYGQVEEYSFPKGKKLYTFGVSGKTGLYGVATYPSGSYL
jgi:SMP-30/Gluconolactonase/LRE-like region